jgi:hypothetical protein
MTKNIPSIKLTDRFIQGLKDYGLSYDEIENGKWRYCGGNDRQHRNYYKLCYKDHELPEHVEKCICGHKINENCYITDGNEILILGNCCIKKFIPDSSRTCERCGEPHKNRKVNRCNLCRKGVCDGCGIKCNEKYKQCYKCAFGNAKNDTNNKPDIHKYTGGYVKDDKKNNHDIQKVWEFFGSGSPPNWFSARYLK